jgi:hypothetical protein
LPQRRRKFGAQRRKLVFAGAERSALTIHHLKLPSITPQICLTYDICTKRGLLFLYGVNFGTRRAIRTLLRTR